MKTVTLKQFVKACGGPDAAAVQLGVRSVTVWRWLKKKSTPPQQGNNARRLKELGVVV